jgi:hypothetical protein
MKIPDGYTEQEVLDIIARISVKLSGKFKFGYHESEDMKQQAALFAWQGLESYDGVRPLENFLWVHVRNRLYNFKRNNYSRPEKPCDSCPFAAYVNHECIKYDSMNDCSIYSKWIKRNQTKKNLMSTKSCDNPVFDKKTSVDDQVFSKEIYDLVDSKIPVSFREDWIRFTNKIKISKNKREQLLGKISEILKDNGIDT